VGDLGALFPIVRPIDLVFDVQAEAAARRI
jgi:hypothetical protein